MALPISADILLWFGWVRVPCPQSSGAIFLDLARGGALGPFISRC